MNIVQIAEEGLKGKDWTLEEQAKYIYHISCEYFTYDTRYYFANKDCKEKIIARKINLEKLEDNRVVCTSHAREVCIPLLNLIGIEGTVIDVKTHGKVRFYINQEPYIMDAAGVLDFMRVKLKRNTRGFYPENRRMEYDNQNNPQVKAMDQKIGYIQEDYFQIEKEIYCGMTEDVTTKMHRIQEFLRNHPQIVSYNDAMKTISYLEQYLLKNFDYEKMNEIELFQDLQGNWDMEKVFLIEESLKTTYFLLKEVENTYTFQEISEEQANQEMRTHRGWNRNLLFR